MNFQRRSGGGGASNLHLWSAGTCRQVYQHCTLSALTIFEAGTLFLYHFQHYLQETAAGRKSDKSHHEDDKEEKEKETKEAGKTELETQISISRCRKRCTIFFCEHHTTMSLAELDLLQWYVHQTFALKFIRLTVHCDILRCSDLRTCDNSRKNGLVSFKRMK